MTWKTVLALFVSVVLILFLFVFAMVNGGFLSWFLFYMALVVLIYEWVTAAIALRGFDVTRNVSQTHLTAGQPLSVELTATRRGFWPLFWARLADDVADSWRISSQGLNRVEVPLGRRQFASSYRIDHVQRGVYWLQSIALETGDLFGLIRLQRSFYRPISILVYPRVVPVAGWQGTHPEDYGQRQPTRRRSEESTNVLGVRDYMPGDRLSRIHWAATARRGVLQAKEFELHVTSELVFLPDVSRQSFEYQDKSLFELEMVIVASLMKYAFERRRKFAFVAHAEQYISFPAGVDEALWMRCMETLASLQPNGRTEFTQSMTRLIQKLARGVTLIIMSPKLTRETASAVLQARSRGPVEWFVPVGSEGLTEEERRVVQMLRASGILVYIILGEEYLSALDKGGTPRDTYRPG